MAEQNNAVQTAEEQKKVYSRQQERRELDNYRQTKICLLYTSRCV